MRVFRYPDRGSPIRASSRRLGRGLKIAGFLRTFSRLRTPSPRHGRGGSAGPLSGLKPFRMIDAWSVLPLASTGGSDPATSTPRWTEPRQPIQVKHEDELCRATAC